MAAGEVLPRATLCEDALRPARLLAALMPEEGEVHGPAALLEFQASRGTAARTGPGGEPVLLVDQSRAEWNRVLIGRGVAALGARDSP